MSDEQLSIIYSITSVLGTFSCTGAVLMSIFLMLNRRNSIARPLLLDTLLWLFIFDSGQSFWIILMFFPAMSGRKIYDSDFSCKVLALYGNWVGIGTITWNCILTLLTFLLLSGFPGSKLYRLKKPLYGFVWTLCTLGAMMPLLTQSYGSLPPPNDYECWIIGDDNPQRLWFYAPCVMFYLFNAFVLMYACVMFSRNAWRTRSMLSNIEKTKRSYSSSRMKRSTSNFVVASLSHVQFTILRRMLSTVMLYGLIWTIPLIARLSPLLGYGSMDTLERIIPIFFASSGLSNFIIWFSSRAIRRLLLAGIYTRVSAMSRRPTFLCSDEYTCNPNKEDGGTPESQVLSRRLNSASHSGFPGRIALIDHATPYFFEIPHDSSEDYDDSSIHDNYVAFTPQPFPYRHTSASLTHHETQLKDTFTS